MKVTRIRLRDYRGVGEREVDLLTTGVTVVAGPNEVGKSSLAEALDVLFDYYDTSTSKDVKALQPVGRDVGAEVEADIQCGPYKFTYAKRFHRNRQTVLTLTAPKGETLVGREAHDRVREILAESMDVDLWKALRVQQGQGVDQPGLGGVASLAGALERAAGDRAGLGEEGDGAAGLPGAGEGELTILERARQEFLRYWTPTGREGGVLKEQAAAVRTAGEEVARLSSELALLESDALRSAELDVLIEQRRTALAAAEEAAAQMTAQLRAVEDLTGQVERLSLARDVADGEVAWAQDRRLERVRLSEALERSERRVKDLAELASGLGPRLEAAQTSVEALSEARAVALSEAAIARELVDERRDQLDALRAAAELEALRQRRRRAAEALEAAAAAERRLAGARLDRPALERIRELHHTIEARSAALEAQLPTVEIRAEARASVDIDSTSRDFSPGQRAVLGVDRLLTLAVPGILEIRIDPGARLEELAAEVKAMRAELERRCDEADVRGLASAEESFRARQDDEGALLQARSEVSRALGEGDLAALDAEISELADRAGAVVAELPGDVGAGRALLSESEDDRTRAEAALKAAGESLAKAEGELRSVREAALRHAAELAGAEHESHEAGGALETARQALDDEALHAAVRRAAAAAEGAAAAHQHALERLGAAEPERVRADATQAEQAAAVAQRELRDAEGERREVQARLEVRGGDGLFEALAAARSRLAQAERAAADLQSSAGAARLLYKTLEACRDEAQQAYAGPLRERIVELGRLVFGPSFDVQLGDDLSIEQRTLNGESLAFSQLSVGAREQLSLIARVACALLVSTDDGAVPLVLDDTLGYSDDDRVTAMHEVLRVAGDRCQVVILTCHPERYRAIPGAELISLQ